MSQEYCFPQCPFRNTCSVQTTFRKLFVLPTSGNGSIIKLTLFGQVDYTPTHINYTYYHNFYKYTHKILSSRNCEYWKQKLPGICQDIL